MEEVEEGRRVASTLILLKRESVTGHSDAVSLKKKR